MKKSTAISASDFAKLVKQANLTLSEGEKTKINAQIDEALDSVKVMSELDTSGIPGTSSASGLTNIFRKDEVTDSFTQDMALANAKTAYKGYFLVPSVFKGQDN